MMYYYDYFIILLLLLLMANSLILLYGVLLLFIGHQCVVVCGCVVVIGVGIPRYDNALRHAARRGVQEGLVCHF